MMYERYGSKDLRIEETILLRSYINIVCYEIPFSKTLTSFIIPKSTLWKRPTLYYKSTLQRCSIICYYLSPLITDLSYPKVLYKNVLLSSKNVALRKLTSLVIPKNVF